MMPCTAPVALIDQASFVNFSGSSNELHCLKPLTAGSPGWRSFGFGGRVRRRPRRATASTLASRRRGFTGRRQKRRGPRRFYNPGRNGQILNRPEHPSTTKRVESIDPIHDGFFVLPERGPGAFAVVYVRSPLRPSSHGALIYTGQVRDWDHGGILRTESFQFGNVVVPTPEPGSIVLFGLGLASLTATRRASRRRRTG
jgi:hypothetical protein